MNLIKQHNVSIKSRDVIWRNPECQKAFLDVLAKQLKINKCEDWYNTTYSDFIENSGRSLLEQFGRSHINAITSILKDEFKWKRWYFKNCPLQLWKDKNVRKEFIEDLSIKLELKNLEDWYSVKPLDFNQFIGGKSFLKFYKHSSFPLFEILKEIYPHFPWKLWKFSPLPDKFWDQQNKRMVLKEIAQYMEIKKPEDWYFITPKEFVNHDLSSLLHQFNSSVASIVTNTFPELNLSFNRFYYERDELFWVKKEEQREFIEKLATKLNIVDKQNWHLLTKEAIIRHGGKTLLSLNNGFVANIICSNWPEIEWDVWKFEAVPLIYWKNRENRRKFLTFIASTCGIKSNQDWYHLSSQEIKKHGGSGLLQLYKDSIPRIVISTFPEIQFDVWRFKELHEDYWKELENRRNFLFDLAKKLKHTSFKDWYSVTEREFTEHGGQSLLESNGGSMIEVLLSTFPEYKWNVNSFGRATPGHWKSKDNQKNFFEKIAKELNVKHWEDWYQIKVEEVKQKGGSGILAYYGGSLMESLIAIYPELPWESSRHWRWTNAIQSTSKSQTKLFNEIREMIPNIKDIFINYQLRLRESDEIIELDIFIPSISLAFEYQGKQHYEETLLSNSVHKQKLSDNRKENICKEEGIYLIHIPYYWNGERTSLIDLIKSVYPKWSELYSS